MTDGDIMITIDTLITAIIAINVFLFGELYAIYFEKRNRAQFPVKLLCTLAILSWFLQLTIVVCLYFDETSQRIISNALNFLQMLKIFVSDFFKDFLDFASKNSQSTHGYPLHLRP